MLINDDLSISKYPILPLGCLTHSHPRLIHLRIVQWDTPASSAARRTVMWLVLVVIVASLIVVILPAGPPQIH